MASSSDDFIFGEVKVRYEFEHDRSSQLDSKASALVGWIGLIITVILAVGNVLFSSPDLLRQINLSTYGIVLLGASVFSLIAALMVGLVAFRLIDYKVVPEPLHLIQRYGGQDRTKTLRIYTQMMAKVTVYNIEQNEKKVNYITATWALFIAGMLLSSVFILIQLVQLVPKT